MNAHSIHALRTKYDPLADHIPPHLTLVFPFESLMSTADLRDHTSDCVARIPPFRLVLTGITGAEQEYLFLNVKVGNDQIIALHDKLYSDVLRPFLNRSLTYIPHLTVGRLKDSLSFQAALAYTRELREVFETTVCEVVVERIAESGQSALEFKVPLQP